MNMMTTARTWWCDEYCLIPSVLVIQWIQKVDNIYHLHSLFLKMQTVPITTTTLKK